MTPAQADSALRVAAFINRQQRAADLNTAAFAFRGEGKEIIRKINRDWSDEG